MTSTTGLHIGMFVISPNVPADRFITALTATTFTLTFRYQRYRRNSDCCRHAASTVSRVHLRDWTISSSTAVICDPSGIVVGSNNEINGAAGYTYVTAVRVYRSIKRNRNTYGG